MSDGGSRAPATSPPPWHALDGARCRELVGGASLEGWSVEEAEARRRVSGPNRLPEAPRPSALRRFAAQFASPLVATLLVAAAVAAMVSVREEAAGSWFARFGDSVAIAAIVVLNAVLGFVQEQRADESLRALRRLIVPRARVRRGGAVCEVDADALVPGDVVELQAGDTVPADLRLLDDADLAVDESVLTGESVAVSKSASARVLTDAPLAERRTLLFLGSAVVRGVGTALVVATGSDTELGRISAMLAAETQPPTPLEAALATFGRRVLVVCVVVTAGLFSWGVWAQGRAWHRVLLEAVSFAVAIIPEGLPAIATIVLALGTQRMARKGAIVRRLAAVETLGAATVICTDKTGTLTRNEMTVTEVWCDGRAFAVEGVGYSPRGRVRDVEEPAPPTLTRLAESLALCNDAALEEHGETVKVLGDPMEGALVVLARKLGVDERSLRRDRAVVARRVFTSERRRMAVVTEAVGGARVAHVKGAVEVMLPRCARRATAAGDLPMTDDNRISAQAAADAMSARALRALAIARAETPGEDPEVGLTLLGIVGMIDPPRDDVRDALDACRVAGVRVLMITGDHPRTAVAIARDLGLWREGDVALVGSDLVSLDDVGLAERLETTSVLARATAEQKLRVVRALQARGEVVAMTGDGVNDAPALRAAHIGVAMGRGGTEVARQAAAVVLTDDRFGTLVEAIREGRAIYRNIQKFIVYLLSSNVGLALAVFAVALRGTWLPLTPLMVLCINFVTNGPPALALGLDPPMSDQMRDLPRDPRRGLLGAREALGIAWGGLGMGALSIGIYATLADAPDVARSLAFAVLGVSPLAHVWSCRAPTASVVAMRPLLPRPLVVAVALSLSVHLGAVLVPQLRALYGAHALAPREWAATLVLSLLILPWAEAAKAALRWRSSLAPVRG